jgi:TRAP-type C4-dicarboxylate transport system substrate-binding protein
MTRATIIGLALLIALAGGLPAQAKTIKLATLAPEGTIYHDILRDLAEDWSRLSGGEIELRIYPGGIAGDEGDVVRKMRVGQIQAAAITGGGLADIAAEIRALQVPMMFRSYAELDYVRDQVAPKLEKVFLDKGFKILAWGDAGWLYFFTQSPVVHPDDLKPLKLFTWTGNTDFIEAWKAIGYHPVPMAATEIHMGLASGLINAMSVPPIAALSFQWFGQAKHMTDLRFVALVGALIVDKRTWNRLPKALRPKLHAAARRAGARLQEARKVGLEAIAVMQDYGLEVHDVPPEVYLEWERRAQLGYGPFIGRTVPARLVEEVKAHRDDYRAKHQP